MGSGGHPDGAGQRRGAQRVEHPDRTGHRNRRRRPSGHAGRSSPNALSTSMPSRTPSSPGAGFTEPETGAHRRGGAVSSRPAATGSSRPDHRDPAVQHPGLVARVVGHRAVPVQVVLGDVEHHAGLRSQRRRPVQLKARQLDREQIGRLVQHVEHRVADVAAQQRCAGPRRSAWRAASTSWWSCRWCR